MKTILSPSCIYIGGVQLFAFLNRRKATVLLYHGVRAGEGIPDRSQEHVPVEMFRRQMAYLAAHRNVVPLSTLFQWLRDGHDIPDYTVAITFDDGYHNNYTQAYPILRHYNLPATIFLTTAFIDTNRALWPDRLAHAILNTTCSELMWNSIRYPLDTPKERSTACQQILAQAKQLEESDKNRMVECIVKELGTDPIQEDKEGDWRLLSWSEIQEMREAGIAFGAHGENHAILTRLSLEEAQDEICHSKRTLEDQLGERIVLFAYPNGLSGDFSDETRQILRDAGFLGALVAERGLVKLGDDPYTLKRIQILGYEGFWHFVASLSGLRLVLSLLKQRVRRVQEHRKGWAKQVSHSG
jgi:peptidoglycan/xylan/chitin deacetylase (PgdA/CDA1 family)